MTSKISSESDFVSWENSVLLKQPPEVFYEKRCSQKFYKNHRKTAVPESLFLIKLQACNFIKIVTLTQVFSCEFWKISKNNFFTEHLWTTASCITEVFPVIMYDYNQCFILTINSNTVFQKIIKNRNIIKNKNKTKTVD